MNGFYKDRPKDEAERLAMIKFHELEMKLDEENATMFEYMNIDHLTKTRINQGKAMVKRNRKESLRALKTLKNKDVRYYNHNEPRTWLV